MPNTPSKMVQVAAVTLLGFTATFTALGAVGTVCVAWGAEKWGPYFAVLVPWKSVYQALVYCNLAAALGGFAVIYAVLRGERWSYVGAIVTLMVFLVTAGVQMYYTSMARNVSFFSTPPTNIRFYTTIFVLLFFLALKVPRIWSKAGFIHSTRGSGPSKSSVGILLAVVGTTALTTFFSSGAGHTVDGYNLVNVLEVPLTLGGGALLLAGVGLLTVTSLSSRSRSILLSLQDVLPKGWLKRRKP